MAAPAAGANPDKDFLDRVADAAILKADEVLEKLKTTEEGVRKQEREDAIARLMVIGIVLFWTRFMGAQ